MNIYFKLFGHNFYVSRFPRKPKNNRNNRHLHKLSRLVAVGYRCEHCGAAIDENCGWISRLPWGSVDRHTADNIQVVCPDCKAAYVTNEKGGQR